MEVCLRLWGLAGVASGSRAASVDRLVSGRPRGRRRRRRRRRPSVLLRRGAVLVASGAVRGGRSRRPPRHLRRPGEPHEANGHTIGLHVVVLPSFLKPARSNAVTYIEAALAAQPDDVATRIEQLTLLNTNRDILLVDQRGTGRSKARRRRDVAHAGRGSRWTTWTRCGKRSATAARCGSALLRGHGGAGLPEAPPALGPRSCSREEPRRRPFFDRYAVNASRASTNSRTAAHRTPAAGRRSPLRERQFASSCRRGIAPRHWSDRGRTPAVVHVMLLDGTKAVSIPLVVTSAANGDYGPLDDAGPEISTPS